MIQICKPTLVSFLSLVGTSCAIWGRSRFLFLFGSGVDEAGLPAFAIPESFAPVNTRTSASVTFATLLIGYNGFFLVSSSLDVYICLFVPKFRTLVVTDVGKESVLQADSKLMSLFPFTVCTALLALALTRKINNDR